MYMLVTDAAALLLLQKLDLTGTGLRKPFYSGSICVLDKSERLVNNFSEENFVSSFLKPIGLTSHSCTDSSLHIMFISIVVYNVHTSIWNKIDWARFVDQRSFVFCDPTVAPFGDLTIEKKWWSVFLQENWRSISLHKKINPYFF